MSCRLVGGDQVGAVGTRGSQVFGAAAALRAQADLHDARDVRHLRGAAHGARQALLHAVDRIPPVQVRIDVHQRDRPLLVEAAQDRRGDAMVAAQDDGQRAGIRKAPDRRFGAGVVFARRLRQVGDDVAAVDEADVVAALQQRAVDIEIIVPGRARDPVGGLPDRGGRIGLVVAEIGRGIRRAERHAQDGDVGLQVVQVGVQAPHTAASGDRCGAQWYRCSSRQVFSLECFGMRQVWGDSQRRRARCSSERPAAASSTLVSQ